MKINSLNVKRALKDVKNNKFVHVITLITIVLSILIVGTFVLFASNAGELLDTWKEGIKVLVYLEDGISDSEINRTRLEISDFAKVKKVDFISSRRGLEALKAKMPRQKGIFENLEKNPIPDTFEVYLKKGEKDLDYIESLAQKIEKFDSVAGVEYGREWVGKFVKIIAVSRLVAISMGGVFFIVAVFIVANTIRLAIYSRKDEIEIMQLVGADEGFIKAPFYIQGLIHGIVGGLAGLFILFILYLLFSVNVSSDFSSFMINIKFISVKSLVVIIVCSTLVGWLGCYISLKQFLKYF